MATITTVLGARPQFIKAAAVSQALRQAGFCENLVHTGQHFDPNMSDVFFAELEIPRPKHNLGVGGGTHGQNTGRMIEAIERVLLADPPDVVMVYGDTDSTLAGAMAAVKLHIPVAHVEAGLRSYNRRMPEEINRVVSDHVADLLFAPTNAAVGNLAAEGIDPRSIRLVGDVMYDAALYFAAKAEAKSDLLDRLSLQPKSYILATVHRAENTDDEARLKTIIDAFAKCGRDIVLPLHPRTRDRLQAINLPLPCNVETCEPLGYLDMVNLERHADVIITDSGGVQKEAFFYKVPCVTLRDETEWLELVEAGWNVLAPPTSAERIADALSVAPGMQGKPIEPYGQGDASLRIADEMKSISALRT